MKKDTPAFPSAPQGSVYKQSGDGDALAFYRHRTSNSFEDVIRPGYFGNRFGFWRDDRIEVTCDAQTSNPVHATLIVTAARPGKPVEVGVFHGPVTMKASDPTWHEILGVGPRASVHDIEAAYRKLARDAHPDHGGNAEEMAALNKARDDGLIARGKAA